MTGARSDERRPPASLQRRVLVIAAATFLAVAALIGFSGTIVLDLRQILEVQRTVLVPARRMVAEYDVAIREQQRGERGFVITSDPRFLESFEEGARLAVTAQVALARQLRDDDEALRLLRIAEEAHEAWVREAAAPAVAAVQRNEPTEAAAIVAELGHSRFERFQAALMVLEAHVDARITEADRALEESEHRLFRLLLGAGVAALVILASVLLALDRWVITPVARLSRAVRDVAAGDVSEPVTVVGPREVVDLADDVEALRLRIVAELEEMRRANEALAQQAPLVVGLRDVLVPSFSAPATIELDSMFLPAEGVLAGDWFDLWTLDDERIAVVVVDISGHGADAGLFALRLKDLLVSSMAILPQPGAALGWVADRLGDTGERFATIFLAVIDPDRGRLSYASAGHPAVLLASPTSIVSLLPTGPLLGPLRSSWETRTVELLPGTVLVAYTDGLIEARSEAGEEFGATRLLEVVTRLRTGRPCDVIEGCRAELESFAAGRFQDDVTLVALSSAGGARGR
ncbi:MAG TPA: SpoIIE family protein phosphatase [Acidimicrobiales bacterium]|nr:SpoIIE family protein phosphatase [Acidimicrobiales bacterium]